MMVQAAVFPKDLEHVISLFSSLIKRPLFLKEEVDQVTKESEFELEDHLFKFDERIPSLVHSEAYQNFDSAPNSYGYPLLCKKETLFKITPEMLKNYHGMWFTPDRIVVAGIGMDHSSLVSIAEKYFSEMKSSTPEHRRLQLTSTSQLHYSGGIKIIDSSNLPQSPNPDDYPFTHVHLAMESVGMNDPDIYAINILSIFY